VLQVEREEGEAPSTVKQERKGCAESEAHWRGRRRQCLRVIPQRGERLGGLGVVAGITSDEEGGGGASVMDERARGQKSGMGGGRRLLWWPGGAVERNGRGVLGSAPCGGREAGKREGASIVVGDSLGSWHRPLAGWPGRRRCCVIEEGGGARATQALAADRRDRATAGLGGQRLGAGGSEREQGSTVRGVDRQAQQHSAARLGFKSIQTESKIFQTDSKFPKLWLTLKTFLHLLQKCEIKYGWKGFGEGTTFLIDIPSDSEWILN
jgi:hypothetical protein